MGYGSSYIFPSSTVVSPRLIVRRTNIPMGLGPTVPEPVNRGLFGLEKDP